MCFSAKTPEVKPTAAMPTERDANSAGLARRQRTAAETSDTNKTGGMGVTEDAKVFKPTLGA